MCRDANICDDRIEAGITVYRDTAEDEESSSFEEFQGLGVELWGQRGKWKCILGYEAERLQSRCTHQVSFFKYRNSRCLYICIPLNFSIAESTSRISESDKTTTHSSGSKSSASQTRGDSSR